MVHSIVNVEKLKNPFHLSSVKYNILSFTITPNYIVTRSIVNCTNNFESSVKILLVITRRIFFFCCLSFFWGIADRTERTTEKFYPHEQTWTNIYKTRGAMSRWKRSFKINFDRAKRWILIWRFFSSPMRWAG